MNSKKTTGTTDQRVAATNRAIKAVEHVIELTDAELGDPGTPSLRAVVLGQNRVDVRTGLAGLKRVRDAFVNISSK